jgi:hypothetical protein
VRVALIVTRYSEIPQAISQYACLHSNSVFWDLGMLMLFFAIVQFTFNFCYKFWSSSNRTNHHRGHIQAISRISPRGGIHIIVLKKYLFKCIGVHRAIF